MLRKIPLQNSVVYGPVKSRRLGSSLGINLLPFSYKLCSSDCVYCQYGRTQTQRLPEKVKNASSLLSEIKSSFELISKERVSIDAITLSGNGESTLHPEFSEIVSGLKTLRDGFFPKAKLGILSDSTQAHRVEVAKALGELDVRYMKLDAGDEETWRKINNPLGDANFKRMVDALKNLPDIILQSMFVQGVCDNTTTPQIENWIKAVKYIAPKSVHVYSIDRAPAEASLHKVSRKILLNIANELTNKTGIPAEIFE
jgi:wyosine [tRNA(Phe)-imidazoG37] synthetase (radical SAM superfamily)